jgi:hypothetical protein
MKLNAKNADGWRLKDVCLRRFASLVKRELM